MAIARTFAAQIYPKALWRTHNADQRTMRRQDDKSPKAARENS